MVGFLLVYQRSKRITTHSTSADRRPRWLVSHPSSVYIAPGSMNGILLISWKWRTGEEKDKHAYSYLCGATQRDVSYILLGTTISRQKCGGVRQRALYSRQWCNDDSKVVLLLWSHLNLHLICWMYDLRREEYSSVCWRLLVLVLNLMQFVENRSWFMIALCAPPLVFTTKITKKSAKMPTRSRLIRPESALAPACREGNHPSSQEEADR